MGASGDFFKPLKEVEFPFPLTSTTCHCSLPHWPRGGGCTKSVAVPAGLHVGWAQLGRAKAAVGVGRGDQLGKPKQD